MTMLLAEGPVTRLTALLDVIKHDCYNSLCYNGPCVLSLHTNSYNLFLHHKSNKRQGQSVTLEKG